MYDVGCTERSKIKCIAVFLELCTDVMDHPIYKDSTCCETGRKATEIGGWLQSLSYAKLN